MKTITKNEAGFGELFRFAQREFAVEWNECCRIFHDTEFLNYCEDTDFEDIDELEGGLDPNNGDYDYIKDSDLRRATSILVAFMKKHGVEVITIKGAGPS